MFKLSTIFILLFASVSAITTGYFGEHYCVSFLGYVNDPPTITCPSADMTVIADSTCRAVASWNPTLNYYQHPLTNTGVDPSTWNVNPLGGNIGK